MELHRRDDPEKAVSSYGQPEQLGVFLSAAGAKISLRVDQDKGLDIPDDGLETQPPAVNVCREGSANA